jgi:hypothetical protein
MQAFLYVCIEKRREKAVPDKKKNTSNHIVFACIIQTHTQTYTTLLSLLIDDSTLDADNVPVRQNAPPTPLGKSG